MLEPTPFDTLIAAVRTSGRVRQLTLTSIGADSLNSLRTDFQTTSDPFERHRAISARIGATELHDVRATLMELRADFEQRMLAAALGEVYLAFARSAQDGWNAWLGSLAAAFSAFHLRHALRIAEDGFPFEASRRQTVLEIGRAIRCVRQERWEEAYDGLELFARQEAIAQPLRARLLAVIAQIDLFRFEKLERARERLEEAMQLAPEDGVVAAAFGDYWLAQKNFDKAAEWYRRGIALAPKDSNGYVGMGERFETDERLEEAERLENTEFWYREAISKAGGDDTGYRRLLRLLGRPSTLQQHESELLALIETKIAVDPEGEYNVYLDAGQFYTSGNDFSKAREWYEKAIRLEEHWPLAYTSLAELCLTLGQSAEAEALCEKAMRVAPECPTPYIVRGRIYEESGRWEDALRTYEAFPPRPRQWTSFARTSVARMHAKLGHLEEAEDLLCTEMRPGREDSYAESALEELAADYYRKHDDRDAAKRVYDAMLEVRGEPFRANYHNLLGNMDYYFADYRAAIDEYREAIRIAPDEAVYHRNLSSAWQLLGDYDNAEKALEDAYEVDKDKKRLDKDAARLANAQGNECFERGDYGAAVRHYTRATKLAYAEAIYHANLAGAWERTTEGVARVYALDQALLCYERAQEIAGGRDYVQQIERLRRRRDIARTHGEKAIDYLHVVTPIAVELAGDLIPYVEGSAKEALDQEMSASVSRMRRRVREQLGVAIPRIRFHGNESDLTSGTYVVFINKIPLVLGTLPLDRRFCNTTSDVLSRLGVSGEAATDPLTRQDGFWIGRNDWAKVEAERLDLWTAQEYLMRNVETVVRKNIGEFVGHQEIVNLLESETGSAIDEIRESSEMITALTVVCRGLLAEQVPIAPFGELCAAFQKLRADGVPLREIVGHIRCLPAFRDRLPGAVAPCSLMKLGPRFEAEIRRSLYEHDGHTVLAMEPERCQDVLAAVRKQVHGREALITDDAALRPYVRRLIELEFPDVSVLTRAELGTDIVADATVELESGASTEPLEFRSRQRIDAIIEEPRRVHRQEDIAVEVFAANDFESVVSDADEQALDELFSMMRDGLFDELGIILPEVQLRTDSQLESGQFRFRLNGVEHQPVSGLGRDEFLVNDTAERLKLLGIDARTAVNPANDNECAIAHAMPGQVELCKNAGLTTWGPHGFLVLVLSAAIRKAAAGFQTDDVTRFALDSLASAFPDLVRPALDRFALPRIGELLRELLDEEISIRDLRTILESLLSITGTTDVDFTRFIVFSAATDGLCASVAVGDESELATTQLAGFVRTSLKSYISHKYTRGASTLIVYLLDREIEERIASVGAQPLSAAETEKLLAAVRNEVGTLPATASSPVVLTSMEIRRALRKIFEREFPRLAVLSYQELSPELNIQLIARISW